MKNINSESDIYDWSTLNVPVIGRDDSIKIFTMEGKLNGNEECVFFHLSVLFSVSSHTEGNSWYWLDKIGYYQFRFKWP